DEVLMCLFEPGFSSAEIITEVSGRGVGMDVVKRAAESIGGRVLIRTELGKGSTFSLALPSSMAVKGALLFELQKQVFAIALNHTEAVISLQKHDIHKVSSGLASSYLGRTIPVFFLHDLFNLDNQVDLNTTYPYHYTFDRTNPDQKLDVVVVTHNNRLVGLVVDKLVQQKEIVEKTLSKPVDHIELFSGATILGNGDVCLVLNIIGIISNLYKEKNTY
ncbi:MAG: chemotaxis protein CheW, partial [Bacteroidia bacterium]